MLNNTLNDIAVYNNEKDCAFELKGADLRKWNAWQIMDLCVGIGNLMDEHCQHGQAGDFLVRITADTRGEIVDILSGDRPLDDAILRLINEEYKEGRELAVEPRHNGTKIAAYYLGRLGGVVSIENCPHGGFYAVRNRVIFPHSAVDL